MDNFDRTTKAPSINIALKARAFLESHGCPKTAFHSQRVAAQAWELALAVGERASAAETAGWLHDISAVIPDRQRLETARQYGLEILPEERAFPMLLHQKISASLAEQEFGITDEAILSAIGCHTTLKACANQLDKIVFIADKLRWDQPGSPPYLEAMQAALAVSLDAAALVYIEHLWEQRASLPGPLHPWLLAAREELRDDEQ